jgi:hypothetical protein
MRLRPTEGDESDAEDIKWVAQVSLSRHGPPTQSLETAA